MKILFLHGCPAWKRWGVVTAVNPGTTILHSRQDDVVPFEESEELRMKRGLVQLLRTLETLGKP